MKKTRFFGLLFLAALVIPLPASAGVKSSELPYGLVANTRTVMALTAAENAREVFHGEPYDWGLNNSCSSYAGEYFRQLGFPMGPGGKFTRQGVGTANSFPAVGTMKQSAYIEQVYPQFAFKAPVEDFLEGKLWDRIRPGSVIYLEKGISHNGWNAYYHVIVLVGYDRAGEPVFADLAVGMRSGPEIGRTLGDIAKMYPKNRQGKWNIDPYPVGPKTPAYLKVLVFDAVGASRTLWQEGGAVYPLSQGLRKELAADVVLTVNINDGTTALFVYEDEEWRSVLIGNREQIYAVVGRYLKAHPPLSLAYRQEGQAVSGLPSFYDGEYGVLYERGVMRRTYTPLMIARIDGFQVVSNFGNIGGRTDIALLYPILEGRYRWEESPFRSDYTFHEVPRGTPVQEILLREPDLKRANDPDDPLFGPLAEKNRSSGCVNFDGNSWKVLKSTLQGYLDEGKTVIVVFAVPGLDQDTLVTGKPTWAMASDPLSWRGTTRWLYGETHDRRGYFTPAP